MHGCSPVPHGMIEVWETNMYWWVN
jgi:hypothetical protein